MSKRYWTIGSLIELKRPSWDTEKTMVIDRINTYIVVSFENPYPYTQ